MEAKRIHAILEKYWEAESSLEEEKILREFFNQDKVPEEFEQYRPLFQFMATEKEATLSGDFEEKLSSRLKTANNLKPRAHSLTFYLRTAAAAAAILTGVYFFFNYDILPGSEDEIAYQALTEAEKEEAQMAYAEAKAALMLMSSKLRKGTSKAEEGFAQVQKATKVIKH